MSEAAFEWPDIHWDLDEFIDRTPFTPSRSKALLTDALALQSSSHHLAV
jgi:hypothetical protein